MKESKRGSIRVLFVCLGNICRSPLAQGVMEHQLKRAGLEDQVFVDSAGTAAYHVEEMPDSRAIEAAARRGIRIDGQRARQVNGDDFSAFDYICAMDADNLITLRSRCPTDEEARLHLLMDFAPGPGGQEVPDPYYGGEVGFEHALDLIDSAVEGLIQEIRSGLK
ncbi:MAG: low molecular weight protein-tyrosine-phosphatase [Gammaproteobacteria bacterium]|nr:low molecular weight protein-tyrosine-phosphatase [Gammaproteobacteria bacterium]